VWRPILGEYITNTDEIDALALDVTAELSGSEAVSTAVCELRHVLTHEDVTAHRRSATARRC
jgi:hypothetical protein